MCHGTVTSGHDGRPGRMCHEIIVGMPVPRFAIAAVIALILSTGCSQPSGEQVASGPDAPGTATAERSPPPEEPTDASSAPGEASAAEANLDDVDLAVQPVVELAAPTALADRSGDGDALYVTERDGRIVRVVDGEVDGQPVLDITGDTTSDGERGLLGLDFDDTGDRLYVSYTDNSGNSRLDAYQMDGNRADATSRRNLLEVAQPYSNHNGGNVVTGPDGLLYYGLGDGGAADDPHDNGQDLSTLLGALLRIDPDGGDGPYAVPDDNPFVGDDDARSEIWVYGLRNPWRFSFDRDTDDLWIADVGQNEVEEINRLPFAEAAGANLGWRVFEGTRSFADGDAADAVPPVHEYTHDGRCSITGGYVYRGTAIDGLAGAYLYGDLCDGVLRAITVEGAEVTSQRDFDARVPELVAFGEDSTGELYALSLSGDVFQLVQSD
jgi:glucose/arabinose dehydrogenase